MRNRNGRNGLGCIIGSIPLTIVGLLLITIFAENIPSSIRELNIEMVEFPEYAIEIQSEIRTATYFGIILMVIGISLLITSIIMIVIGLRQRKEMIRHG